MLTIKYQSAFKKDYKRIKKRGYDIRLLEAVIESLANEQKLDRKYKDHELSGKFVGCRECHITSDWLLIYEIVEDKLILEIMRTGTHSDLFQL